MEKADFLINELRKGQINWYEFKNDSKVLFVGSDESVSEELRSKNVLLFKNISADEAISWNYNDSFDYIIVSSDVEKIKQYTKVLEALKNHLDSDGHLILFANNRLGLRYFCGDRDIYTKHSFDGIEGYIGNYVTEQDPFMGRTYDKSELTDILEKTGFKKHKFFTVISDLNNPNIILSEDYYINEDLSNRVFPTYNHPDTVFLEEQNMYNSLINNGMFHTMANAYIIDCTINSDVSDINCITSSLERGKEYAMLTIIHKNRIVEKKAVYPEGEYRLKNMVDNLSDLKQHGINIIDTTLENGKLIMPFIHAKVGQVYLKQLFFTDKEKLIKEMDHFVDLILRSSDIVSKDKNDGNGVILAKGYPDLVPLNSFVIDGEFYFYDQEFCIDNYPANVIIWRFLNTLYFGNPGFTKILPIDFFINRYNLSAKIKTWQKMAGDFLSDLRNEKALRIYHEKVRRNYETINSNRQRINFSDSEYKRLFVNIFDKIGNKKIILFGSGNFTKRFIAMYGKEYPIYAIIDNNSEKWGQDIEGIRIVSPDILKEISEDDYKIIVCIKKFNTVANQLDKLGFRNYSIFDTARSYPKQFATVVSDGEKTTERKKYHIGYVAGVFDMYHVGHLNMFRKAKEQCDYLIVGVVPDEGVFRQKNKYPIIPCEDRVEIVQSCRYVDKAEALPLECRSIRDAYKMYRFDCMFTGTDYVDNPDWLAEKEYLKKNGADIMFFPYTEKVSSSMLREKLK